MMLPGMEPVLPPVPDDGAAGDEWYTPQWFLDCVGEIALDPCWSHASLVRAAAVIDLRTGADGLVDLWEPIGNGVIFVNPPFSRTAMWLFFCRKWANKLQRVVVVLVPAFPGDGPWHKEVWPFAAVVGYVNDRMDFVNPNGRIENKGRGHAVILYGPESEVLKYRLEFAERAKGYAQAPVWTRRMEP